ncbi:Mucin-associated surface protein (MASP) [Trypanosoma cruzi]|uniref:Mucin-associated surface protein (MASP), putative n=2 Tax=Trypanosoma cruzi TaxID=5693 RepID=Q4CP10_TRYCC|nr:mucin-associated surface protein (MASP), putative [Trypanosoma cruzi]EAN82012.1 mucin-associated surface protein (MASP), putative [Trypanosoma cruzi]PWV20749.1 Mucin-associated surface protein (MASP) [Trypanosoma cruzi]|eukprot:XP_803816.1 mucin-associated surface protein (MASP) [Trypanosoma cruzi strain CL Brener]
MAMMMTGRALLVCALCVLWCGAVFGYAMEDYCGEGGGNGLRHTSNGGDDGVSLKADCGLLSTRMALIKAVEAADGKGLSGDPLETSQDSSPGKKLDDKTSGGGTPGLGGGVAGPATAAAAALEPGESGRGEPNRELEVADTTGEENANDRRKGAERNPENLKNGQSSSFSSGSPVTLGGEGRASEKNSKAAEPSEDGPKVTKLSQQKAEGDKGNKNDTILIGVHENPEKNTEIQTAPPPPANNGKSSPEDTVRMQQLQQVLDGIGSNNNSQTNSIASIAVNKHNEPSGAHAESGPPSPTANGDAVNNEADNSTEDGMPNNGPAADGAGTREKQNENKDANPKETPVTAAAMKTTTATTGDSDGSTAVSHTTSPLFLLLVFACAAAAAVVAA